VTGRGPQVASVDPWTWQESYGYSQAIVVTTAAGPDGGAPSPGYLVCSGQTSVDADGRPVHAGDMAAQLGQALDNVETVLAAAGFVLHDVVRLNMFTTDVDAFFAAHATLTDRLGPAGCTPASTLLGVTRLGLPELLVELEVTAVRTGP
jgi:enamine deaminase RidA (YjgF/YER057c/UK114 family)